MRNGTLFFLPTPANISSSGFTVRLRYSSYSASIDMRSLSARLAILFRFWVRSIRLDSDFFVCSTVTLIGLWDELPDPSC